VTSPEARFDLRDSAISAFIIARLLTCPMIDEAVHLESFRPQWEQVFVAERNRLATCLKVEPNTIEHIGSTAVSGMVC